MTQPTITATSTVMSNYVPLPPSPLEKTDEVKYKKILKKGQDIVCELHGQVLSAYHELGVLVLKALELVTERRYASSITERFAKDIGVPERVLRNCVKFAKQVDKTLLKQLISSPVCWEHVRTLINQGELDRIEHWAKQITQENLSATHLEEQLRGGKTSQRKGSGRKPAIPSNFGAGLVQLDKLCTNVLNKFDYSLFCEDFDLAMMVSNAGANEITEETHESFVELIDRLEEVAEIAADNAAKMKKSLPKMNSLLAQKEQTETDKPALELSSPQFPNS